MDLCVECGITQEAAYHWLTWHTDFMKDRPDLLADDNMLSFISPDGGAKYDACSCTSGLNRSPPVAALMRVPSDWSENELADLDFYRSESYGEFFDHLDHDGGFYDEVTMCVSTALCADI